MEINALAELAARIIKVEDQTEPPDEDFIWPPLPTETKVISEYNLRKYMECVCDSNGGKAKTARLLGVPYQNLVGFINHGMKPSWQLLDSLQMIPATVYVIKNSENNLSDPI